MASGPFLMGAGLSRYRALGVAGDPVWRRAPQLRAAIEARLGRRHADLFALPQIDEIGDKVDWYASFDGAPRAWADLDEASRRSLEARVAELRPELERLVARLDGEGRGDGERAFGRLLREALYSPGTETLFAVDGRPVLAFWGFAGDPQLPGAFLGIGGTSPTVAVATQPSIPSPAPAVAAPAVMAAVVPAVAGPSNWWKWLLLALFLLLLLALSAWLVRPHLPQWAWDGRTGLPSADRSGGEPGATTGVDESALRGLRDQEGRLQGEIEALRKQFADKRLACAPGSRADAVPGGVIVLPDGQRATPDGVLLGPDGKPMLGADGQPRRMVPPVARADADKLDPTQRDPTSPKADAPQPRPDATKPPTQPPQTRPRDTATVDPKAQTPPSVKPGTRPPAERPIEPVRIPTTPGVEFMAGDWRSNTDLTTQGGDDVVRPQYSFDKNGLGKTRIVQKNGVVCEGPATAAKGPDGKLVIRETDALKCTDGTTYAPSTVTCAPGPDGKSVCRGSTDGGPGYTVELGR